MLSIELIPIIIFAAFTQAALGFGFGLIFVSLGSLFFSAKDIIPLSFIMGLFMDAVLIVNTYKFRPKKRILDLVLMGVLGAPIGLFLFHYLDISILEPILGVFLIIAIIVLFFDKLDIPHTSISKKVSGFMIGIIGALFGVAGPFISIFLLSDRYLTRKQNIYVMNSYFIGITFIAFLVYFLNGAYDKLQFLDLISLTVFTIFGVFLGLMVGQKLSKTLYVNSVYVLILISGIMLIMS
tara:strand:- start:652 stop:1365 length:714 start_codon:yes stop_codon:yes gene_type:complete